MPRLEGRLLADRYRVEDYIGGGGMADVYKVWDEDRSCYLAIKVLRGGLAEFEDMAQRFSREAETLSRLQHPNIVRLYGLEREGTLSQVPANVSDLSAPRNCCAFPRRRSLSLGLASISALVGVSSRGGPSSAEESERMPAPSTHYGGKPA